MGNLVSELVFKQFEPLENPVAMEDNIVVFHEEYATAFILEYKNSVEKSFKGTVYLKLICDKEQEVTRSEIVNKLPENFKNQLITISNKVLHKYSNSRTLFIDQQGNPTSGDIIIPLTFQ
jgi:hypothetical protein